uniref:Uncharacterized protein n=1 Tax=Anguilla anguilla TaxID=7936 RepID=A0A0E9RHP9_ANGAN
MSMEARPTKVSQEEGNIILVGSRENVVSPITGEMPILLHRSFVSPTDYALAVSPVIFISCDRIS